MRTPNMSDEELDSLFQRGAEAYSPDCPAGAWARMEDKLNVAAATQQLRQKVVRVFIVEVVVLSLLLGLGYRFVRPVAETAQQLFAKVQPAATPAASPGAAALPAPSKAKVMAAPRSVVPALPTHPAQGLLRQPGPVGAARPALPAASQGRPAASQAAPAGFSTAVGGLLANSTRRRPANSRLMQKALEGQAAYLAAARKPRRVGKAKPEASRTAAAGPAPSRSSSATSALTQSLSRSAIPSLSYSVTQPLLAPVPNTVARLAGPLPSTDSAATAAPRRPERLAYRLVVGVLGAPALTAVRTPQTARLGGDFGLTLEYRLTSRLRVRAAFISSEKRYTAASSDYTAPDSWMWFTGDYYVEGSCRVTEIPLDLRYDVLSRPTYLVFGSLGLNSLLMRDEVYSYDWMKNGQTMTRTAHVVNGSNHAFSVVDLSVGFERLLGRRWSVQAEPFWQLPLGGVGAGQVRLSSAGAAFSLKYGLFR